MSAGHRSASELFGYRRRNDASGAAYEEEKPKHFKRSGSEKHFSVRNLVHQFESRASNRFERISERFSSKRKKSDHINKDVDAGGSRLSNATPQREKSTSTTLWYLPSDKISDDNHEWEIKEHTDKLDEPIEEEPLPDVTEICDCWNEFIYLQLSKRNAEYLNSYDSDFEEDCNETPIEASNTIISLKWPGDVVHYIVHGYYPKTDYVPPPEQDIETNDAFSESDESVFYEAEDFAILPTPQVDGDHTKLYYPIEELLNTERNYINTLEKGVMTYIHNVFNACPIPVEMVNMRYHLFGNIEFILKFHKAILLPKLVACGQDVEKLSEVFCKYLDNDSFYGYVLYALYHRKSQELCEHLSKFFEDRQNQSGDKLGVKSFILAPVQRLPRYKLLLASIAKASRSSESVHAAQQAEKKMESFITTMNDAMAVVEIIECEKTDDNEVELGFGVPKPATVLREQNSENQFLFLYPKDSDNVEKIKPINLLHQGKFKKMFPVFFNDLRQGRQYKGRLFIFERCVIYTEMKSKNFSYRGHFSYHEVSYDFSNLQILRIISEKDEQHKIEVKINIECPSNANLVVIVELLRAIIAKRKKKESFVVESKELIMLRHSIMNRFNSCRSSLTSTSSNFSYFSSSGQSCPDDHTSIDCSVPLLNTDTDDVLFEQMVNYIQYYEKALKDNINFYINSLPDDVRKRLFDLREILEYMYRIQQDINDRLFENNVQTEPSVSHFCDIFHDTLKQSEFDVYLRYVQHYKSAESVLMSFEQYFTGLPKQENAIYLSIDAFIQLPVEFINRCCILFEGIYNDTHSSDDMKLRNTVLDYKISYVHDQLQLLRQRVNENYYIRQLIMDIDFLQEIELVQYSEIIKLEGSFANYRLFLMKTGLLCMKIRQEKNDTPETYSSVTLYYPYTKTTARNSHRSGKRWSAYLDGRKTTLMFQSKLKRHAFNERYTVLAEKMREREGVRKKTFFSAFENI
ncbi:uncharacterized protein LOC134226734 [Armigeres subalbatus]|uniref:uncharacterized protein LOC134226734 n=1 Tax=Armigeres subalbatus TaxID=124917 RepID=UPI002ED1E3F0